MIRTTRIAFLALLLATLPAYADLMLKQSTASQSVKIGPFVSSTDGNTESTALTIANTDILLSKNGGTLTAKNSGGGTHDANGMYTITLDATDTNTAGRLQLFVHKTGALPVYQEFNVIPGTPYDAQFGTSALGYVANAPVNVAQFGGVNGAFASGRPEVNTTFWTGQDIAAGTGPLPALGVLDRGTAQADSTTSVQLRSAATFADNELNGATYLVYSATTGAGQRSNISAYTGSTDTATVSPALPTDPTGTNRYEIYATSPGSLAALWDEALSSHTTAGTTGERLGRIPNVASGSNGGLPTVDASNRVTALISTGTGAGQLSIASGAVTVGTNNDKSSYTLSSAGINAFADQSTSGHTTAGTWGGAWNAAGAAGDPWSTNLPGAYGAGTAGNIIGNRLDAAVSSRMATFTLPTNFSSISITGGGAVTAGTVSDKSGYSLSQAFPTNFSSLAITVGGAVTVGTVNDKTGYRLSTAGVNDLRDVTIEDMGGGVSLACVLAVSQAVLAGDITTTGGNTTWKDPSGTEVRYTSTVTSSGNRTGTITCPTLP
jgi:hypothetical protein